MALRAALLRENLLETGDPLPLVGHASSQILSTFAVATYPR